MSHQSEDSFFFDGGDALNAVFAGFPPANIQRIEKAFSVTCVCRDLCVKVISDSPASRKRASAFIRELVERHATRREPISPEDFSQLLGAFQENREKELHEFFSERIKVGKRKADITPRTRHQFEYVRSIRTKDIVFGIGPAGTGKTYLAMAMAVSEFLAGRYSRIILTRPAREAGENLGFLPGKLEEKILPYLRPLYDALHDMLDFDEANSLMEKNIIELAPLAFMRGRTLNHAFVILDEAQNASSDQMLMFLTRLGFDSCCVITGDPTQTDLAKNQVSGLGHANKILAQIPEIAFCHFDSGDVVRHSLVEKIIDAYSRANEKNSSKGRQSISK